MARYSFKGNEDFERVHEMLEESVVLSDRFKTRVVFIMLKICTDPVHNAESMHTEITKLKQDMFRLSIFSEDFMFNLQSMLLGGLLREENKLKKK